jgi:hypothetical protein
VGVRIYTSRGKPEGKNQTGTVGTTTGGWRQNGRKTLSMKQGDLSGPKPVFTLVEPKSRPLRSQSTRSSDETG